LSDNVESPRQPVLAGNWKMFKTTAETVEFFGGFKPLVEDATHCEIVIAPPFPALSAAVDAVRGTNIKIGAQNLYWKDEGAFTGEVSGPMIAATGCTHVIVGHSERRQYFGETDETVNKRVSSALGAGLTPIVCVGESLEDREQERTESVLARQFEGAMASLTERDFSRIILAYEPVWAIGTGRTATPEIAGDAHRFLRHRSAHQFGEDASERLRILYGGSVKPSNVRELMARPEIDGALVGGASLEPESMAAIVNYT
jgi:triosephosphate isomerase